MHFIYEAAGYISGFLNACMLIPQVYRSYINKHERRSEELSDVFLYLDIFTGVSFLVYGIGIFYDTSDSSIYLPILVTAPISIIWPVLLLALKYNFIGKVEPKKQYRIITTENDFNF
jgi:uncharacterized protein with PQ loop repeat